jgi:DNA-3-methyladenine glycosylase I
VQAFDNFEPRKVAGYGKRKIAELMGNVGIIRNRAKIEAAIGNAQAFLKAQEEYGNFDDYIWQFVGGEPIRNHWKTLKQIPAETNQSQVMSKDLKAKGFRFVGPTICYAYMQATGMVNDHVMDCYRYKQISGLK